ncbi:MAG TPA: sigma-70 family RNA polymerase sigma factor [Candidatus Acidoferrales bacterium]|nr:sigma-70 family RNA polymerase sigma factor [Candidatus Acidoferrales bacterium]
MDFESLYKKYAASVRRFALFLCGDPAMADDITSDTFVRVWLVRGRIRELTVKSYLFTIARNAYRDLQRRGWRRAPLDEERLDTRISADMHLEQKQELAGVLAALQELPEIDRAALLMRALDDMSYEEIATALEITSTTAKVKVHRARMKLMQVRNPAIEKLSGSGERL